MATQAAGHALTKIRVRVQVGDDRMAGTDDPLFLRLEGPGGREFRLAPRHGRGLRRGKEDSFELGGEDATVAHAEFNDPSEPAIDLDAISEVCIRKGLEPIPNVRGVAELDDRLQIMFAEVELMSADGTSRSFQREGPIWLGLMSGLWMQLVPADGGA